MNFARCCLVLLLTLVSLSACGSVRESLGLGRNAPDEFAVIDRPPLSMPPDFGLRPPAPGAPARQDVNTEERASEIVFGPSATSADTTGAEAAPGSTAPAADNNQAPSDAEKALLAATGADKAEPNIRNIVDREDSEKVVASKHLVDELLWWKPEEKSGVTVDAAAETQRIKDAKDKGEALNTGATPVIEREKTGWLGL